MSINSLAQINEKSTLELERTPGAAAVSGINGRELAGGTPLLASPGQTQGCGVWVVLARCVSGLHAFAKRIVCGKEWCPDCGKDNSPAHKRRIARLLSSADADGNIKPRFTQVKQLGYFVIEFPEWARDIGKVGPVNPDPDDVEGWCYSKAALRQTTNDIVSVLAGKRMGRRGRVGGYFRRGLLRWHWFGSENPGKWNPHANVLVDSGYLAPELLEDMKRDLRKALNVPDLIVNYSYTDSIPQMFHKLRYITRATFKDYNWDPYMAEQLFNFRNQRWWGKWNESPAWTLDDAARQGEDVTGLAAVTSLQSGICPDCGQPLETIYHSHDTGRPVQWTKPVDATYLMAWDAKEIAGTGYYRIPQSQWSGYSLSPDKLIKATRADWHVAVLSQARKYVQRKQEESEEHYWNMVLQDIGGPSIEVDGEI